MGPFSGSLKGHYVRLGLQILGSGIRVYVSGFSVFGRRALGHIKDTHVDRGMFRVLAASGSFQDRSEVSQTLRKALCKESWPDRLERVRNCSRVILSYGEGCPLVVPGANFGVFSLSPKPRPETPNPNPKPKNLNHLHPKPEKPQIT